MTVQQYRQFIKDGGYETQAYWTMNGWKWNQDRDRVQPSFWGNEHFSDKNQPVVGITWYEVTAFAAWLKAQLANSLPEDYHVYVPTEAQWEVACAYDGDGQRHLYPWGEEKPKHDLADFAGGRNPDRPAPVGCCPAGVAACGALDMVGSVWEITTSSPDGYPGESGTMVVDFTINNYDIPWRGGGWENGSASVHCAARDRTHLDHDFMNHDGFRLVISPLP
ncbi:MAG: formylglycine-generating enzyme family protein [Chloroflexaceae bacterium]|nr:formylglycine-generating enzyme family protein [Chloroflexaceae bacterium]